MNLMKTKEQKNTNNFAYLVQESNATNPRSGNCWVANRCNREKLLCNDKISLSIRNGFINYERFHNTKGMKSITTQNTHNGYSLIHIHSENMFSYLTINENIALAVRTLFAGGFFNDHYGIDDIFNNLRITQFEIAFTLGYAEINWDEILTLLDKGKIKMIGSFPNSPYYSGVSLYSNDMRKRKKSFIILYDRYKSLENSRQPNLGFEPGDFRLEFRLTQYHIERIFFLNKDKLLKNRDLDYSFSDWVYCIGRDYLKKQYSPFFSDVINKPTSNENLNWILL